PIRIIPVNDAPIARADTNHTVQDFAITTADVLANDYDVEGDPIAIASYTQPVNGMVVTNGPGTFLYTPNTGYLGEDSFTYTVTDGRSNSLPAVVTVFVGSRDQFRWINSTGGNWSDPANWS